jgi:hypothetical protein
MIFATTYDFAQAANDVENGQIVRPKQFFEKYIRTSLPKLREKPVPPVHRIDQIDVSVEYIMLCGYIQMAYLFLGTIARNESDCERIRQCIDELASNFPDSAFITVLNGYYEYCQIMERLYENSRAG